MSNSSNANANLGTAVVTGASSGIGAIYAKRLLRAFDVRVFDRRLQ